MKYIKSILITIAIALLVSPGIAAASVPVSFTATSSATNWISPGVVGGVQQMIRASGFLATSTTVASFFNLLGIKSTNPSVSLEVGAGSSAAAGTAETIKVDTTGDARLWLKADADNVTEDDNPCIGFAQDGSSTFGSNGLIGVTGNAATDCLGSLQTGTLANSLFIDGNNQPVMIGAAASTFGGITVDTNDNVGIGSTTPAYKLSVTGNEWHNGTFFHFGSVSSNSTNACAYANCFEYIGDDNTIGGHLIGIQNINAGTSAYQGINMFNNSGGSLTTGYAGLYLTSTNYSDSTFGTAFATPSTFQLQSAIGPIVIGTGTTTQAASYVSFLAGGFNTTNEMMRITPTGVGIGTTTPTSKLHVVDTLNSALSVGVKNLNSGTTASSEFIASNDRATPSTYYTNFGILGSGNTDPLKTGYLGKTGTQANASFMRSSDGGMTNAIATTTAGSDFNWLCGGDLISNECMRLTNVDGALGIGTSSPMAKLSVGVTAGGSRDIIRVASSTLGAATTTAFLIDKNGKVGINLSGTPNNTFTVNPLSSGTGLAVNESDDTTRQALSINGFASGIQVVGRTNGSNSTGVPFVLDSTTGATSYFMGNHAIGTTTAQTALAVFGTITSSSTPPTLSSCGTSPTVIGNNNWGEVTVGATATGCTITFATTFPVFASCLVTNQSMSVVNAMTYTVSKTVLTVTQTGLGGAKINYNCSGY